MDIYQHWAFGFLVSREDFLSKIPGPFKCSHGHHRLHPRARFCEVDGTEFCETFEYAMTDAFIALASAQEERGEGLSPSRYLDRIIEGGTVLHPYGLGNSDELICGTRFETVLLEKGGCTEVPWQEIHVAYLGATELRDKMEFQSRSLGVFSWVQRVPDDEDLPMFKQEYTIGCFRDAPIMEVRHADLDRIGGSAYRSQCPACPEGVLGVYRDPNTYVLLERDRCLYCAQQVQYTDIEDLRRMDDIDDLRRRERA